jgi:Mitochondrial biogenesis AIM24
VLAYSLSNSNAPPTPYRFKSSSINLQIPIVFGNFFPSSRFVQNIKKGDTYKFFANIAYRIRTWSRRTIWGDRLFLQFTGPTTLLLQSRSARLSDALSTREVNEIADAPPGVVRAAVENARSGDGQMREGSGAARTGVEGATVSAQPSGAARKEPRLSYASVTRDGKVKIEETKTFSQSK